MAFQPFQLPQLPFASGALEPHISTETISFHYGKHHKAYVDKVNKLLEGSPETSDASLEDIVRESSDALYNNSAQAWNHAFFWHCLSPKAADRHPSRELDDALEKAFGSMDAFLAQFAKQAEDNFGSGWTWLIKDEAGDLSIVNTSNADTPIRGESIPLLVVDVWEHAYYLDYRNARNMYLAALPNVLNWRFASDRYGSSDIFSATDEMRYRRVA